MQKMGKSVKKQQHCFYVNRNNTFIAWFFYMMIKLKQEYFYAVINKCTHTSM